jgi:hypothetical protein
LARYESANDVFELNMTLFETQPVLWGGTDLIGASHAAETLGLFLRFQSVLPGTYLHSSEALLYTEEGFRKKFVLCG